MSKERFEIFGADDSIYKLIKDNEELPNLLNMELACVRMNEFVAKISDLEAKLAEQYAEVEKVEQHYLKQREYYTKEFNEIIDNLKQQLAEHNEYFDSFNCKDFNEFKDFISTFMLTPHEEQTLIQQLKQLLAEKNEELEKQKKYKDQWFEEFKLAVEKQNSVAIQQLERVKDNILDIGNGYWRYFMKNGKQYMTSDDLESCLNETIDQIIAEIKQEGK